MGAVLAVASAPVGAVDPDRLHFDWAFGASERAFLEAVEQWSRLDRAPETARLTFASNSNLAATDLGPTSVSGGLNVALASRGRFLQDAMPPGFAAAGGPAPFSAGALGGRDLLAGVKATGRAGALAYGVMTFELEDAAAPDRHEQVGVGRVVLDVAQGLRVGAIATAGDPRHDGQSYLVGTDLTLRTNELIEGRALEAGLWVQQSMTAGGHGEGDGSDRAIGLRLAYPNDAIRWSVGFTQVGDHFDASMGSVPRRGVREYSGLFHARLRPGGFIRTLETGVETSIVSQLDGAESDQQIRVSPAALELATNDQIRFDYILRRTAHAHATTVGPQVLPAGEYAYGRYEVSANTTASRPVRLNVRFGDGAYYTGQRQDARVAASWQVNPMVQVSAGYEHADVQFEDSTWTSRVVRGNLNVALAPTASWTNAIWHDHVNGTIGLDGRLRWEIEPGNEVSLHVSPRFAVDEASPVDDAFGVVTSFRWSRSF